MDSLWTCICLVFVYVMKGINEIFVLPVFSFTIYEMKGDSK